MKALLLSFSLLCLSGAVFAKEYTLGIVPQQSPIKLYKSWKPVTDYLSEKTGFKVTLKTEKSIAEFEKVLYDGGYDLSYMNPFHYTVANERQHYDAVVRAKKMIRGILVMKSDDAEMEALIKDKNTKFLFPSANAFAATLIIKYEMLTKFGVDLNEAGNYQYVNSHDSVYLGVERGIGQLGGGIQRTFNNFKASNPDAVLKEVYQTEAYPSHPIAVRADMPEDDRAKLVEAFLEIPEALLADLSMKKIISTEDDEFSVIRELSEKLDVVVRD
ncbi:PhnD/SsuA/transferrin family substrate-binding protein [Leucothrix pacifica]|uniref:Phosphate ABC transporter substrate-binding protein n=1 Tax=Leucothrix pacifica TaxID=1247513 RepID=A0A317CA81_9GAMM|nr:PhnD/SsuA/transferrin family substrate-binding protein [Leucothrix pacifica]PWQ95595.1 phosphate ABC transporter substrate-binding protein [Leucothrix pacifica]